jgi:drug/metabolite transporter (DMT)-like permease
VVLLPIFLALASSAAWGVSDFLGGFMSRRVSQTVVLLVSQTVGMALLLPLAVLHGPPQLDLVSLASAIGGSVSGLVGIAAMYRGMAVGSMSIVAPISATGAAIPVLVGLLRGERATPLQSLGIGLAILGVVLASRAAQDPHTSGTSRVRVARGVGPAILAAVGFGGFFVLLHEAAARDVLWAGFVQRSTGVGIVLIVMLLRRPAAAWSGVRPRLASLAVIGVLDTSANVLYSYASVMSLVSLAAVLASLFPVVTVILARIVLHERLAAIQGAGVVCALIGVACIAAQ